MLSLNSRLNAEISLGGGGPGRTTASGQDRPRREAAQEAQQEAPQASGSAQAADPDSPIVVRTAEERRLRWAQACRANAEEVKAAVAQFAEAYRNAVAISEEESTLYEEEDALLENLEASSPEAQLIEANHENRRLKRILEDEQAVSSARSEGVQFTTLAQSCRFEEAEALLESVTASSQIVQKIFCTSTDWSGVTPHPRCSACAVAECCRRAHRAMPCRVQLAHV